ncbi:MAG: outer membrane beta-barrel protein [Bacteroidales bacterium]|nr:outer membrane beta-barrel protein [Bacteroidales bacterium]
MKTVFKTILAAAAVFVSLNVFGQSPFSVTAGYLNVREEMSLSYSGDSFSETTGLNGFFAGVGYEMTIGGVENLSALGQLVYAYCGNKENGISGSYHNVNVPIRVKYTFDVSDQIGIFAYAGPVASIGLIAKNKEGGQSVSLYKDDLLKRFDVKIGAGIGVEVNEMFSVYCGYDKGLLNLMKSDVLKIHTDFITVGISYNL